MNREEEIKELIRAKVREAAPELEGYKIFLFGSRASGTVVNKRADFDVGVLGNKPLPLKTFYHIEDIFDSIETLYHVDWVDLKRVSPSFRKEALRHREALI